MCGSYESAVHRPGTAYSAPLTLHVIISDGHQKTVSDGPPEDQLSA
jgi:hypothetical protein